MTKHITITLTEDQAKTLLYDIADTIHDLDDYSFDDGEEEQRLKEKSFYKRIYTKLQAELVKL